MKNINPLRTARRIEQRLAKLGPDSKCFYCPESDIACLELEHPVGQDRDVKLTRVVCRNCHRKREWERDIAGLTTNGHHEKESAEESFYKYLLLLAADHEATAASLRRKAEEFRCLEGT
jgi:hypothetical protein